MPVNPGPEYVQAEKRYLQAQTLEERIIATEDMIRAAPKHKSSENLLALLRTRLKKFLEKKEKNKKVGKTTQKTVRKEGYQIVLLGFPNVGKSSLLSVLTNARPSISPVPFTTNQPELGTFYYQGVKAQVVDLPAIGAETFDIGIVNTADCILIVINNLEEIDKISPILARSYGRRLYAYTKSDLLSQDEFRRLQEKIRSKKIPAVLVSNITNHGLDELRHKILEGMNMMRIYTKEPGKLPSQIPLVIANGLTVKDAAEKIAKGFSLKIKETRITGPSSKFPNQRVGLSHILKDKDIVEFHTV
ncbi:TGS domain-containing protein [Candidatus Pacearchaeota archaeon]|nr:TGS domain-containing protein [Candidatus Pacearchaeota archaeon]